MGHQTLSNDDVFKHIMLNKFNNEEFIKHVMSYSFEYTLNYRLTQNWPDRKFNLIKTQHPEKTYQEFTIIIDDIYSIIIDGEDLTNSVENKVEDILGLVGEKIWEIKQYNQ